MESLVTAFVAALLGEWGDKSQLFVIALAVRHNRHGAILSGVALAAFAASFLGAIGGVLLANFVTLSALTLLVALALVFAGVAGFIPFTPAKTGLDWRRGVFTAAAAGFFLADLGDRTQFITGALAARFDSLVLTALGATAGILVSTVPAVLLGDRLAAAVPLRALRVGTAILFLLTGFAVSISALRLI